MDNNQCARCKKFIKGYAQLDENGLCPACRNELGYAAREFAKEKVSIAERPRDNHGDVGSEVANGKKPEKINLIITTTNSIDGEEIEKYLGVLSDRLVIGAGLFSEFFAGFTDVFGGRSEKFENRMQELYDRLMESLKTQAIKLNADAIVGLKIDMDEISGKGTQMFMISGLGTAVKFKSRG